VVVFFIFHLLSLPSGKLVPANMRTDSLNILLCLISICCIFPYSMEKRTKMHEANRYADAVIICCSMNLIISIFEHKFFEDRHGKFYFISLFIWACVPIIKLNNLAINWSSIMFLISFGLLGVYKAVTYDEFRYSLNKWRFLIFSLISSLTCVYNFVYNHVNETLWSILILNVFYVLFSRRKISCNFYLLTNACFFLYIYVWFSDPEVYILVTLSVVCFALSFLNVEPKNIAKKLADDYIDNFNSFGVEMLNMTRVFTIISTVTLFCMIVNFNDTYKETRIEYTDSYKGAIIWMNLYFDNTTSAHQQSFGLTNSTSEALSLEVLNYLQWVEQDLIKITSGYYYESTLSSSPVNLMMFSIYCISSVTCLIVFSLDRSDTYKDNSLMIKIFFGFIYSFLFLADFILSVSLKSVVNVSFKFKPIYWLFFSLSMKDSFACAVLLYKKLKMTPEGIEEEAKRDDPEGLNRAIKLIKHLKIAHEKRKEKEMEENPESNQARTRRSMTMSDEAQEVDDRNLNKRNSFIEEKSYEDILRELDTKRSSKNRLKNPTSVLVSSRIKEEEPGSSIEEVDLLKEQGVSLIPHPSVWISLSFLLFLTSIIFASIGLTTSNIFENITFSSQVKDTSYYDYQRLKYPQVTNDFHMLIELKNILNSEMIHFDTNNSSSVKIFIFIIVVGSILMIIRMATSHVAKLRVFEQLLQMTTLSCLLAFALELSDFIRLLPSVIIIQNKANSSLVCASLALICLMINSVIGFLIKPYKFTELITDESDFLLRFEQEVGVNDLESKVELLTQSCTPVLRKLVIWNFIHLDHNFVPRANQEKQQPTQTLFLARSFKTPEDMNEFYYALCCTDWSLSIERTAQIGRNNKTKNLENEAKEEESENESVSELSLTEEELKRQLKQLKRNKANKEKDKMNRRIKHLNKRTEEVTDFEEDQETSVTLPTKVERVASTSLKTPRVRTLDQTYIPTQRLKTLERDSHENHGSIDLDNLTISPK